MAGREQKAWSKVSPLGLTVIPESAASLPPLLGRGRVVKMDLGGEPDGHMLASSSCPLASASDIVLAAMNCL